MVPFCTTIRVLVRPGPEGSPLAGLAMSPVPRSRTLRPRYPRARKPVLPRAGDNPLGGQQGLASKQGEVAAHPIHGAGDRVEVISVVAGVAGIPHGVLVAVPASDIACPGNRRNLYRRHGGIVYMPIPTCL